MTVRGRHILALAGVIAFVSILLGCATGHQHSDLTSLRGAPVEVLAGEQEDVEINNARVYQHGNDLVVLGEAKRTGAFFTSDEGHFDVAVVQPGREPVMGVAEYRHHPSRQILSRFDVHLRGTVKPGTRIYIVFHPVTDDGAEHSKAVEMLLGKAES